MVNLDHWRTTRERAASLAQDLVRWQEASFWPSTQVERFYRRVRRLAKAINEPHESVLEALKEDALSISNEYSSPGAESTKV